MDSICRMQLRPIDVVVSPDTLKLCQCFPYLIRLKICKICIDGCRVSFRREIRDEFIRICIDCIAVKTNCSGNFFYWDFSGAEVAFKTIEKLFSNLSNLNVKRNYY